MDANIDLVNIQLDLSFNPRARDGRETLTQMVIRSTHCFNPRARDGREVRLSRLLSVADLFQSTRP